MQSILPKSDIENELLNHIQIFFKLLKPNFVFKLRPIYPFLFLRAFLLAIFISLFCNIIIACYVLNLDISVPTARLTVSSRSSTHSHNHHGYILSNEYKFQTPSPPPNHRTNTQTSATKMVQASLIL